MTEGSISELIKWWIYLMLIVAAIALFMFFYEVGQTNRFVSFVAAEIERGGVHVEGQVTTEGEAPSQKLRLTPESEERVQEENNSHYSGRYEWVITTETDPDDTLGYGDIIDFEVTGSYPIFLDWFAGPTLGTDSQAIVQVRTAGSQGERTFARSPFDHKDFTYNGGTLTGFSSSGLQKYGEMSQVVDFIVPDKNPHTNEVVTSIAENAFTDKNFIGSFIAPEIRTIGRHAFSNASNFNGQFNAPKVEDIGESAFQKARFIGDFKAEQVKNIGKHSFRDSRFDGSLIAPRTIKIGDYAFLQSTFVNSFNIPTIRTVGIEAFKSSDFEGYFNGPKLYASEPNYVEETTVGGSVVNVEYKKIGKNAFQNSYFLNGSVTGDSFVPE